MSKTITDEFLKYRRLIASLLSRLRPTASSQDIEDILQETYINTYKSSLKQEINFPKAFMVKTALRLANRNIEISRRTEADEEIDTRVDEARFAYDDAGLTSCTEHEVLNREKFGFLCEAVDSLPTQCRKVFVLKKIYGLSQKEIAKELGISESTVEKHVAKGLLKTMQHYDRREGKSSQSDTAASTNVHDIQNHR